MDSMMESINIKSNDQAGLSESLLGPQEQTSSFPPHQQEQVVFVEEEREVLFDDEVQNFGGSGGGNSHVVVTTGMSYYKKGALLRKTNNTENSVLTRLYCSCSAGERQPNHWRDLWAAVLFLGHQGLIFYLAFAWGIPALNYSYTEEGDYSDTDDDATPSNNNTDSGNRFLDEDVVTEEVHLGGLLWLCFLSSIGALLLGTGAISVMIKYAEKTIQFSMFFAIFCNALVALSFALEKQWIGFAVSSFFLVWVVIYTRAVWNRVPFAASNLLAALTAVQQNGGLILVSLGTTVAVTFWTLFWILALVGVYMKSAECHDGSCETHSSGFSFLLLLLSYYWTSEVSKNIMHVTTAGTVGTWWFAPDDASAYFSPAITDSFRRATTYSLGSICFGSLLTAVLQLLHQICHEARRRGRTNAMLLCVVEAILAVLESIVIYFNKWAMIYVGLYGYDYLTSGTKVVALFRERGWTAIINDHLVTRALSLVAVVIGALTGCMGMALASATGWVSDFGDSALPLAFFLPFICGLALSVILLSVVASAVDTIVVSFAESPLEMERNHPGLYVQMSNAWAQAFPEEYRR